ncbi:MAG: hypothetical protein AAF492_27970, partial [Verrucomicrobiota bacterium]
TPDYKALDKIANDKSNESRIRLMAFQRLREAEREVPAGQLLGTVVEVRWEEGLDTVAVFTDGRVRYIHHTGSGLEIEGADNPFKRESSEVIAASRPIYESLEISSDKRPLPPRTEHARLTFLASDGVRLQEGRLDELKKDAAAKTLIESALDLVEKQVGHAAEG